MWLEVDAMVKQSVGTLTPLEETAMFRRRKVQRPCKNYNLLKKHKMMIKGKRRHGRSHDMSSLYEAEPYLVRGCTMYTQYKLLQNTKKSTQDSSRTTNTTIQSTITDIQNHVR